MRHNVSNSQHAPRVLCHTTHHGTAQNRWLLTSADHCTTGMQAMSQTAFSQHRSAQTPRSDHELRPSALFLAL